MLKVQFDCRIEWFTVTLVEQIGNEKIEKIVSEIRHRSQVLQDECLDDTQQMINDEGVIWPTLKENRATNITCWTSTRGMLFNLYCNTIRQAITYI